MAELGKRLRDELQPVGIFEEELVDRIATALWRFRRVGRIDAGLFALQMYQELMQEANAEARQFEGDEMEQLVQSMHRKTITNEVAHTAAVERRETIKADLNADETAMLGKAFSGLDVTTLSRYEAGIEQGLYKALHELQRIQVARRGQDAQLPVAIDMTRDSPERPRDE